MQAVKAAALQRSLRLQDLPDLAPELRYITLKDNQYFCVDVPCQEQDQVNQWRQINAS
ncbi:hypothetical protein J7443_16505 [Tropicibacter sp. R15_0]|uniref:hypothetical protein n=1 Tax=Tropicibacter sp. R15_0 TaxID=2821101 RepID=UPI001ADCA9FC|nr:hypothetical protein [Tropicibacter sp. R15_0]MBO9466847.1 hypothetical protein [Tropicibacter sp. R15_0]